MAVFMLCLGGASTAAYHVMDSASTHETELGRHDVRIENLEKTVGKMDAKLDAILDELRKRGN